MYNTLNLIIIPIFVIVLTFQNRTLRLLKLDPNRARDFFSFIAAYFLLILLYGLIFWGSFAHYKILVLAGLLLSIPISILQDYFIFRKIKDNILFLRRGLRSLLAFLIGVGIAICIIRLWSFPEILSFFLGYCFTSLVIRVAYVLRYEKKFGLLMISKS
jgi:hypothetical protein